MHHSKNKLPRSQMGQAEKAEQFYSITSSACASSIGGTSMPSVLAVCRFMVFSVVAALSALLIPHFSPKCL